MRILRCPQCGERAEVFREGVCEICCAANQQKIDAHWAFYERWQSMSDRERAAEIKSAST